jgi:hypothetical protein
MLSHDDAAQLAHAASEQRAILTFNAHDFNALHETYATAGKDHWGSLLSTEESIGTLMRRLLRLLHSVSAQELKNQIRWLNESR